MALTAGTRLGPYEIVSLLGAGGMGEVYRARDSRLHRDVALKVLAPELAIDPDRVTRFEREARAASSLNHPAIVTIHDIGRVDGTWYIAMELVDGASLRAQLAGTSDLNQLPTSWSPDGRMLAFTATDADPKNLQDIWALSLEDPSTPRPVIRAPNSQLGARISPDGHWLAYVDFESGQSEVYVTRFPEGTGRSQLSAGGGTQPVWARSGRELFYRNGTRLMAVPIEIGARLTAGKPVLLFEGRYLVGFAGYPTHDVSITGDRFVMIQTEDEDVATNQINVVLGWAEELTRRARATKP